MPKTIAIVCEYNPFHTGHEYQIQRIREEFGVDSEIIGIMSGNFTQRGECAIADKYTRAKCAVLSGVNLILELPFPFSSLSAELFASAAVYIANSLGVVDYLSFGSEAGELAPLDAAADIMLTSDFERAVSEITADKNKRALGYPEKMELALRGILPQETTPTLLPNNILAVEYIKALKRLKSKIMPHTIKRQGADYRSESIDENEHPSATALRNSLLKLDISALQYVPKTTQKIILDEIAEGNFPCDIAKISSAIISSFRLNSHVDPEKITDVGGGLYNRLLDKSYEAGDIDTLLRLAETKLYTRARLRRAILYSFLGVTSSEAHECPQYTQVLAMDNSGKSLLKKIRKVGKIPVLTKPSRTEGLSEQAKRQWERAFRADSVFQLTKPKSTDGRLSLMSTPYVKK